MGLLPKYKIEELKREKREAKAAKKRKENTRSKIVRFLIVCEGSRTELFSGIGQRPVFGSPG